tara:strand:+ start:191 stop:1756 length:1566 start_codon:yes stop_codon:yes gene_type:complete
MDKETLNNWIMYHEIIKLDSFGFSKRKIANYLGMNWRTVNRYLKMSDEEFEEFLSKPSPRNKVLSSYADFILGRLRLYPETSAAQMFDWLKEAHPDLPKVSERTVYNFVMFLRREHNLPKDPAQREFFAVEEFPYGEYGQVDFGQYTLDCGSQKRKKVYFFAMVLSRSRAKSVSFLDRPFTAADVCVCHEAAFEYFGGIPKNILYDQDRTLLVDENMGDLILTHEFRAYATQRKFKTVFCRKADPQTKGMVENVVGYVKKNFLHNRKFIHLEILNQQALEWLERTGNRNVHNVTKRSPLEELSTERSFMEPFTPIETLLEAFKKYTVRKTNQISYKGNYYSVPQGTYQPQGTEVLARVINGKLEILTLEKTLICTHSLAEGVGRTIINTDHKRDKSQKINDMMQSLSECFTRREAAMEYFEQIRTRYGRYIRDQMHMIKRCTVEAPKEVLDETLDFCVKNSCLGGSEFEQIMYVIWDSHGSLQENQPDLEVKPMDRQTQKKANEIPEKSNLADYENIIDEN